MKIDWKNVIEEALGAVLGVLLLSLAGWLGLLLLKSGTERILGLILIVVIAIAVITYFVESVRHYFGKIGARIIDLARKAQRYRREILSTASFVSICILVFLVYGDLRVVGLIVAYTAFLIFSFIVWNKSRTIDLAHTGETSYKELSLDQIATGFIGDRYRRDFSLGDTQFGGVPFFIKAGKGIYDTGEISPEDLAPFELLIEEAVEQVRSIYLLINAGGAWKKHKASGLSLEGMTIGSIQPVFDDESSQKKTNLDLGRNIREWAPGNFPGELIDEVSDPLCREVWEGENSDGEKAIIDMLEIPILRRNRSKALDKIIIASNIKPGAPLFGKGGTGFFILAITLGYEDRGK